MPGWIDSLKERPVLEVARALGLAVDERRRAAGPCPACRAERRHTRSGDRRGALGVRPDGRGWRCFQCDAAGDAVDLATMTIGGGRWSSLPDARRAEVREWAERWTGAAPSTGARPWRPLPSAPVPSPTYPPADELAAVWAACVPVLADAEVRAWLAAKGIAPADVADADLARAMPTAARVPEWADRWRLSHRLVVPFVDARGVVRSYRARSVDGALPKSLAPRGFSTAGLVLADGLARRVLGAAAWPSAWPADRRRIVVTEGEKKWLQRCAPAARSEAADAYRPAVVGVESGAWTDELAARIPDGSVVLVSTDRDDAGRQYGQRIVDTLADRMLAQRVTVELGDGFSARWNGNRCTLEVSR